MSETRSACGRSIRPAQPMVYCTSKPTTTFASMAIGSTAGRALLASPTPDVTATLHALSADVLRCPTMSARDAATDTRGRALEVTRPRALPHAADRGARRERELHDPPRPQPSRATEGVPLSTWRKAGNASDVEMCATRYGSTETTRRSVGMRAVSEKRRTRPCCRGLWDLSRTSWDVLKDVPRRPHSSQAVPLKSSRSSISAAHRERWPCAGAGAGAWRWRLAPGAGAVS